MVDVVVEVDVVGVVDVIVTVAVVDVVGMADVIVTVAEVGVVDVVVTVGVVGVAGVVSERFYCSSWAPLFGSNGSESYRLFMASGRVPFREFQLRICRCLLKSWK